MFETQADYISWLEQLIEELTTRSSPRGEHDELLSLATQWCALFAHLPPTQQAIQPMIDTIYQKWLDEWKHHCFGSLWLYITDLFHHWAEAQGCLVPAKFPPFSEAADDIALCSSLLATTSKEGPVYVIRGDAYLKIQGYDQAIMDYTQAMALLPEMALLYAHRGDAFSGAQAYDSAIADYSQALTLAPQDTQVYLQRGRAYGHLQRYQLALRDYTTAISFNSRHHMAYYERGVAYEALGDHQQALAEYETTIQYGRYASDPYDLMAFMRRGTLYDHEQRYHEAIAEYSTLLHRLWFKRGLCRPALIQHYTMFAQYHIGCASACQGDTHRAIEALNTSIDQGFDGVECLLHEPDWEPVRASQAFQDAINACRANALKKAKEEEHGSLGTKSLTS